MQISEYLGLMGQLYFEGAVSDFSSDLLRLFGGSLVMASRDTQHIRIDPDSWLGMRRRTEDCWTAADIGWRRHCEEIHTLFNRGVSPSAALFQYCATFQTTPHLPAQLQASLHQVWMPNGSRASAWQVSTLRFRERVRHGGAVMSDTFGALTTMGALAFTSDDWMRATPAEWDQALKVGEVGVVIGQMAGARADARQQWRDMRRDTEFRTR